jgi:hypothetical protein
MDTHVHLLDGQQHRAGVRIAVFRVVGERRLEDAIEFRRHDLAGAGHEQGRRISLGRRAQERLVVVHGEETTGGHRFVQDHCERVEIGRRPDLKAPDLLGRHVTRRAHHRPGGGQHPTVLAGVLGVDLDDSEVQNAGCEALPRALEHDVVVFEVPVDEADVVRIGEAPEHLPGEFSRLSDAEGSIVVDLVPQRPAFAVLHHDVERVVRVDAEVEHADDERAVDADAGLRLAHESRPDGFVLCVLVAQELHGDAITGFFVPAAVHGPHAAHAQALEHGVAVADQFTQIGVPAGGGQRCAGDEVRLVDGTAASVLRCLGPTAARADEINRHDDLHPGHRRRRTGTSPPGRALLSPARAAWSRPSFPRRSCARSLR